MKILLRFIAPIIASFVITGCLSGNPKSRHSATIHPLVGRWELVEGRRPFGQPQFMADAYFHEMQLHHDGTLYLKRDIGTETTGTWLYDEGAEALILRYRGGYTGAGFPAQHPCEVFSHIILEGDTLTFPELGSQRMTYRRSEDGN